jgi:hypothetical protein
VTFPAATIDDLYEMLEEVDAALSRMDSAVIVDETRWTNLRETRIEHRDDVLAQIAENAVESTSAELQVRQGQFARGPEVVGGTDWSVALPEPSADTPAAGVPPTQEPYKERA